MLSRLLGEVGWSKRRDAATAHLTKVTGQAPILCRNNDELYDRTDIDAVSHGYVRQAVRQSLQEVAGTYPIADIIGPKYAEVVNRTQEGIAKRLSPYGIVVKQFTVNELRAPDAVMQAINQKNVMQQQALTAQNELQKNTFQAQGDSIKAAGRAKAITAEAEAQAKANQLLSQSIPGSLVHQATYVSLKLNQR